MGDVGERVGPLLFGERPVRPVGEAGGLVEVDADDGADEVVVADAVAEAADAGGDLGVEDVLRHPAGELDEDFDVLPGGVEDLGHLLVGEELEERREVEPGRQRIDQHRLVGVAACSRQSFGQYVVSRRNSVSTVTKSKPAARSQKAASTSVEVISSIESVSFAPGHQASAAPNRGAARPASKGFAAMGSTAGFLDKAGLDMRFSGADSGPPQTPEMT